MTMRLCVSLLLVVLVYECAVGSAFAGSPCPDQRNSIYPCTCHEITDKGFSIKSYYKRFTFVICSGITHASVINNVTQYGLKRMNIDRMVLVDSTVNTKDVYNDVYIQDNYYRTEPKLVQSSSAWNPVGVVIRELSFYNTTETRDFMESMNAWNGFYTNLKSLRIESDSSWENRNSDNGESWDFLEGFTNLDYLALVDLSIYPSVSAFPSSLARLKTLDLSFNRLNEVHPETFTFLTSLSQLSLSNNHLKTLNRNVFSVGSANSLTELDISWNPITHLPFDFFLNMNFLRRLDLRGTLVQALSAETVHLGRSLNVIDLRESFLVCNCSLSWIASNSTRLEVKGQCKNPKSVELKEAKDRSNYAGCETTDKLNQL